MATAVRGRLPRRLLPQTLADEIRERPDPSRRVSVRGAYEPDRSDFPHAILQNGNEALSPDVVRANELGEDRDSEPGEGSRVRE
jgi:hypothetical protein